MFVPVGSSFFHNMAESSLFKSLFSAVLVQRHTTTVAIASYLQSINRYMGLTLEATAMIHFKHPHLYFVMSHLFPARAKHLLGSVFHARNYIRFHC